MRWVILFLWGGEMVAQVGWESTASRIEVLSAQVTDKECICLSNITGIIQLFIAIEINIIVM